MENEKIDKNHQNIKNVIMLILYAIFIIVIIFIIPSINNNKTDNKTITESKDSHVISCAKSALIEYAKYDPEIGTTKILESDSYGRYLIECYAKLVNAFGTGKYDTYYIIIYNVHEENGEWYYTANRVNGIYSVNTVGQNAKELVKEINNWGKPIEE